MVPPMVRLIFPVSFLLSASAIMGRSMTETEFENTVGNMTMDNFLQDNGKDRNVLFGRLLAVYDYMEQRAMYERDENGKVKEGRTTNAKRYWNAYSSRPARTSKTIRENLIAVSVVRNRDFHSLHLDALLLELFLDLVKLLV